MRTLPFRKRFELIKALYPCFNQPTPCWNQNCSHFLFWVGLKKCCVLFVNSSQALRWFSKQIEVACKFNFAHGKIQTNIMFGSIKKCQYVSAESFVTFFLCFYLLFVKNRKKVKNKQKKGIRSQEKQSLSQRLSFLLFIFCLSFCSE